MSHVDYVAEMPEGFTAIAHTADCPVAAMANVEKKLYAMQYHPEVNHTDNGTAMLKNFLMEVCHCDADWTMANYAKKAIEDIPRQGWRRKSAARSLRRCRQLCCSAAHF